MGRGRDIEIPWDEADKLTHAGPVGRALARNCFVEVVARVPQPGFNKLANTIRLRRIFPRDIGLARHVYNAGNGYRVAVHVAVDGRTISASANAEFHAVAIIDLPVQSIRALVGLFPLCVILAETGKKVFGQLLVRCGQKKLVNGIRSPKAVASRLALGPKPEVCVVLNIFRIPQPAGFADMVPGSGADGISFSRPINNVLKFVNDKTARSLLDVFLK